MVKTYLKYQLKDVVGLINGKNCRPIVSKNGKFIYTGCNEYVLITELKTGEVIKKLLSSDSKFRFEVTAISLDRTNSNLAVGYSNGSVIIYDILNEYTQTKKFSLHKSAITSIDFNKSGNYLATGSKDTLIYIWDIIGESVLYKLSGHKDNISKISFHDVNLNAIAVNSNLINLNYTNNFDDDEKTEILISSSKDSTVKLWNLKNQETLQTIADLVHKVTDFIAMGNTLILASYDNKIRIYKFQVSYSNETKLPSYVILKGNLIRQSNSKVINLNISCDNKILSILSNDNTIEFFKILSDLEIKRKILFSEMKKNKKNEKREKLIKADNYQEAFKKSKTTFENEEYNFKFNFYSIFTFTGGESKITSQFFIENKLYPNIWKFATGQSNNSLDFYEMASNSIGQNVYIKQNDVIKEVKFDENILSVDKVYSLESKGHRDVLRFIKFSENNNMFLTCSNEAVKIWNFSTLNFIKGIELQNIISASFILRDKYVILFINNY
jgi:U3 small nucleolar RNA-associated protein 12